jgi:hypothetical protein
MRVIEASPMSDPEEEEWREMGMNRLEEEWDNEKDAIYDD